MDSPADNGRLVRYARVSTDDQDLSLQLDALKRHGVANDLIFTGKLSDTKNKRLGASVAVSRPWQQVIRSLSGG